MNKFKKMDQPAVQDKGDCWICFNNENNIVLTTVDSERTLKSCETNLDTSIIIKRFEKENQVSCCSCCFESTRQLISLEEQVQKLQKEISEVSSGFSQNVLHRRSRLQNEIKNASNSDIPTEKCFKILNYLDRPSFEMIENVTVKEEVIETSSSELSADSEGNTKIDDIIVTDPWLETFEDVDMTKEECETAFYSEDAIDVKYSYDEIESREVGNHDKEIVTHQGLAETNTEENEQAKTTTTTADLVKCLKMPNSQLKGVQRGKYRNSPKIDADAVEENTKCEKALDDSREPNNSSKAISKELRFKCHEISCSKSFKRKSELTRHQRIHSEEKPYKCSSCSKSFRRSRHLTTHLKIHSGEKPYDCNYCEKSFLRRGDLKKHERVHTGEKPFICSSCSKSFKTPSNLRTHQATHSKERPYKGSLCEKSFKRPDQLKQHERIHSGERPYKCSICPDTFRYSEYLKRHEEVHTGKTRFNCSFCSKSFHHLSVAKRHEMIHTGERPYKCSSCEKSYRLQSALKSHAEIHTGERNFICSFCSKSFLYSSDLKIHERVHTGERPFNCSFCSNSFTSSSGLKRHEKSHTGERPHKCSFCSKSFMSSSDLKRHQMIHTNQIPHKCSSCDKTFSQRSKLKIHYDRMHGDEEDKEKLA